MTKVSGEESLSKFLIASAGIHLAVFALFIVQAAFYPSQPLEIAAALRVDIVDLPDKILDPAPQAKSEKSEMAEPVQKAPKKPKVEEQAIDLQKKQNRALAKLKQDSALDRIKEELKKEQLKKGPTPTFKGNQITVGTEMRGLVRAQHDEYVGQIERSIRSNWALPEWLANKGLRAQVQVKISNRGEVAEIKLLKSSGNPSFDENVMGTVKRSSPLPPPPERLEIVLRNEGIVLGFPE